MQTNSPIQSPQGQETSRAFLITPGVDLTKALHLCPSSTTLEAYSRTLDQYVVIQIRCKRWGCPSCGRRKCAALAKRIDAAEPNKFVTLTIKPDLYPNPREAYVKTSGAVARLAQRFRKRHGPIEYVRVLESTKAGWPHYHLMMRGPYIPQSEWSGEWKQLTGAHIVDVRQIKKRSHVTRYIMKYLSKQTFVPFTDRRISWTRRFFPKTDWKPSSKLDLHGIERKSMTVPQVLFYDWQGYRAEPIGADGFALTWVPKAERENQ